MRSRIDEADVCPQKAEIPNSQARGLVPLGADGDDDRSTVRRTLAGRPSGAAWLRRRTQRRTARRSGGRWDWWCSGRDIAGCPVWLKIACWASFEVVGGKLRERYADRSCSAFRAARSAGF